MSLGAGFEVSDAQARSSLSVSSCFLRIKIYNSQRLLQRETQGPHRFTESIALSQPKQPGSGFRVMERNTT